VTSSHACWPLACACACVWARVKAAAWWVVIRRMTSLLRWVIVVPVAASLAVGAPGLVRKAWGMAGCWYTGPGSRAIPTCSCPSAKLAASTNVFHSVLVTLAGSAGVKGGTWMRCAILVDWAVPVAEVAVSVVGADDQVGGWKSCRCLCLAWGLWLWEGVENPGLVFTAPTEGDPIEF